MDAERNWCNATYRSHWISVAVAVLMVSPGVYCQVHGAVYRNAEPLYYGWPFLHPDDVYRFVSNAFWLDLVCMLLIAAATGMEVEALVRTFADRIRFRLSAIFL